ncbi:MAG: tetratricopeptide repeat protein [Gammaproteobacteria bacterium]|nr:tetratricopeptide repeat protein [Gammaproteobacteria bacterium]
MARQRAQLILAVFQSLSLIIMVTGCAALPVQATQDGRDTPAAQRGSADSGEPGSATSPTMSAASQSLLQQSRSQQRAGDYPQAAATLERALRVDPSQPVLWLELGRVRLREGQFAQAEQLGRKVLSISGGNLAIESDALDLISRARRAQGLMEEAN